jgi:hypothetical protein
LRILIDEEINWARNIIDYNEKKKYQFRIRLGSNIGRVPNEPTAYISKNYKVVEEIAQSMGHELISAHEEGDDNMYHMMAYMNGHKLRIIQWPDATTLDLKEIQTEAIADILPGKPPSPLVHQVILRDGAINKGLMLWDTIPKEYVENYGNKRN